MVAPTKPDTPSRTCRVPDLLPPLTRPHVYAVTTMANRVNRVRQPPTRRSARLAARTADALAAAAAALQRGPTGILDLPPEVRRLIYTHLLQGVVLQLNPGGGALWMPPDAVTTRQTARLMPEEDHFEDTTVVASPGPLTVAPHPWDWQGNSRTADEIRLQTLIPWYLTPPHGLLHDLFNLRQTSRAVDQDVQTLVSGRDIPVVLTSPGLPDLAQLTPLQCTLATSASTLIFRHGLFDCVHAPITDFIVRHPNFQLLVMPRQHVEVAALTTTWNSGALVAGIRAGDWRAHRFLERALADFLPHTVLPQHDGRPRRWVGEVVVYCQLEQSHVPVGADHTVAGPPAGPPAVHPLWPGVVPPPPPAAVSPLFPGLRCIVARDITAQAEPLIIMGVEPVVRADTFPPARFSDVVRLARAFRSLELATHRVDLAPAATRPQATSRCFGTLPPFESGHQLADLTRRVHTQRAFETWFTALPPAGVVWNLRQLGGCISATYSSYLI